MFLFRASEPPPSPPDAGPQPRQPATTDAVLLDVRETPEWKAGHAPGAVHAPLSELVAGRRLPAAAQGRPLVVICRCGHRSQQAAKLLAERGARAVDVKGGMNAWAAAGLPGGRRAREQRLDSVSALILALVAGAVVGLALGALGGGGSVLAVPALIYLLGFTPAAATTASLIIVTATSATALYAHARDGNVALADRGAVRGRGHRPGRSSPEPPPDVSRQRR